MVLRATLLPARPGLLAIAIAILAWATTAAAQVSPRGSLRRPGSRSSQRGGTAGGGTFPTWEREVEADERAPLPWAQPGRFVPAWTLELGAEAAGVASLGARGFVVALRDGRLVAVSADGASVGELAAGGIVSRPPVSAGPLAVVAAGEQVVAWDGVAVAWRSERGARIVRGPAVHAGGAIVAREGGSVERMSLEDGRRTWIAAVGGDVVAGPAVGSAVVVVGVGGEAVALDAATGVEAWRVSVGDRVDAVGVLAGVVLASGLGVSGRATDVTPVIVGQAVSRDGTRPQGHPWRLRVGGRCEADPVPSDELVAFACADGYVRAIERRRGVGGWKTDLPTGCPIAPVRSGARLDFVIPGSRHAVSLNAENGAVIGWVELPDEDETFVGTAATSGGVLVTPTSFGRLLAWTWEWVEGEEPQADSGFMRPGQSGSSMGSFGRYPIGR